MKKLFILVMFMLISMNIAFASDFNVVNGVKYISTSKAKEIWNVGVDYYDKSSIVKITIADDTYYLKLYESKAAKNAYINPFFINSPQIILNGDVSLEGTPFQINGEIYIPISLFYNELYSKDMYDVIVIGGEPEGVVAAISAARNGAKTLLCSEQDGLGGLFTYGMLNTLDMNYNKAGELLTRGIFDEFYDKIGRTESFSTERVKQIFKNMVLAETNIDCKLSYTLEDVILDENEIKGVLMKDAFGRTEKFYAKRVIDATQNGDVCAKAGVPYFSGMEDINVDGNMAATLVFKVGGVNWNELANDISRYTAETGDYSCGINESSAWGFGKWCYSNYNSVYYNMKFRGPNIGLQDDGTVLINALQIFYVDPSDEKSINEAKKYGEIEARNALEHLRSKLKAFENAYFIASADELYIREARHIQGEYVLQASDLLEGVNFYDKIAMGAYPLDIQSTSMSNNGYVVLAPDQYSIPYRCIVPKKIDNLFIVGKSASYSSVAAGSARVVPIGMVEGESAGAIAMYSIINNVTPRSIAYDELAIKEITKILIAQGVYLPDYKASEPYNNIQGYEKIATLIDYGVITGGYDNNFRFGERATIVSSANVLRNYAVRRLGKSEAEIKEELSDFSTYEEIAVITLLRMVTKILDKNYEKMSDNELWNVAISKNVFQTFGSINMYDTITMEDMYIIGVNAIDLL